MGEDEGGFCPAPHLSPTCPAPLPGQGGARWASYEDFGQGIGTRAGDKGLAGVAGNSVDGLLMLLAVGRDLLHARFVVQAPQTKGAVMAWEGAGAGRAVTCGGSPGSQLGPSPKTLSWPLQRPRSWVETQSSPCPTLPSPLLKSLPAIDASSHQVFTEHLY